MYFSDIYRVHFESREVLFINKWYLEQGFSLNWFSF